MFRRRKPQDDDLFDPRHPNEGEKLLVVVIIAIVLAIVAVVAVVSLTSMPHGAPNLKSPTEP